MKVDIAKAYDKVDWNFLLKSLAAFGFDHKVVWLIHQLISTSAIVVLLMEALLLSFIPLRG